MKTLISMTDFVLKQNYMTTLDISQIDFYDKELNVLSKIRNYANFLKQPLTLGMFVPTDENGNILTEPIEENFFYHDKTFNHVDFSAESEQYNKAKEKVLFSGWSFKKSDDEFCRIYHESGLYRVFISGKKIEDLLNDFIEYELNENALKQIGL